MCKSCFLVKYSSVSTKLASDWEIFLIKNIPKSDTFGWTKKESRWIDVIMDNITRCIK